MAFLVPLLGSVVSGIAGKLLGAEQGVRKVHKKRELIMIHEGELVAPKRLADKIRKDPKYKKEVARLPTTPQNLSKADKRGLKKMVRR